MDGPEGSTRGNSLLLEAEEVGTWGWAVEPGGSWPNPFLVGGPGPRFAAQLTSPWPRPGLFTTEKLCKPGLPARIRRNELAAGAAQRRVTAS